jgi:hypothetical protein
VRVHDPRRVPVAASILEIPDRQLETSVVLADPQFDDARGRKELS